jgi:hypothetical protein
MSDIQPISDRASFVKKDDELSIVISSSADKSKVKVIGALLALWLAGGIYIISSYFSITDQNTKIMMLVWIAFWAYFTYIMGRAFSWQWRGREIIKVREGKLFYKRDVGGRGWVENYTLAEIRELQSHKDKTPTWVQRFGGDYWSTDCDSFGFKFRDKEVAMGYRLSEKESEKILKLLKKEMQK